MAATWLRCVAVAVGCCALVLLAPGPRLLAQQPPSELRSIRFEGARAFPDPLLRAAIISTESKCKNFVFELIQACRFGIGRAPEPVDTLALMGDVFRLRVFYADHGYREAQVELETRRAGPVLYATFHIKEGAPVLVHTIELGGTEALDSLSRVQVQRLVPRLPLKVGQPLDEIVVEATRDTLIDRLHNSGYANAEVFKRYRIPRDSGRVAHAGFDLAPGSRMYFGDPVIQNNQKVSTRVIRRMLAFRRGDTYSRAAILNSQRNLFGLEIFRSIDIRTDLDAAGDTITPHVLVEEGPLGRVRPGVGLSTAEYINTEFRWTARNFFGGARRIEIRARLSNILAGTLEETPGFEETGGPPFDELNYSLNADVTQPWFFDLYNSLGAGLFFERRSLVKVFVRTSLGGYFGVTRALAPATSISLSYRPELNYLDAEDEIFCISFVACEQDEIRLLREPHWLAPVSLSFARDRSNSLFSPTRGYILRLDAEYAASTTLSEFGYSRLAAEWTTYREPLRGLVLATRVRPGWARAIDAAGLGVHPSKRFFAGGANSVRGFGQNRLGPQLLTINAVRELLDPDPAIGFDGCTAQQINGVGSAGACNISVLADSATDRFTPRPVGGAFAFEGNLEARFPLIGSKLRGAAFVDVGQVWTAGARVRLSDMIWTPGVGLRYASGIGTLRIDLGYNTAGGEQLQVLTNKVCLPAADGSCTADSIVEGVIYPREDLRNTRELTSLGHVPWGINRSPWSRLQLHFSIGQAF
jgi:outer membrane protein insertion porin family/translocation and assembly module TamA